MKRIVAVILAISSFCAIASAERFYYFDHLNTLDGLPSNTIYCAMQDKDGFMWIGTRDGLCRYDGRSFIRLSEIAPVHNRTGLVREIAEDEMGKIWFTTPYGVGYYNPKTDEAGNINLPGNTMCRDLDVDGRGNVWIASHMLFRYDTEKNGMFTYSFGASQPEFMAVDSFGTLWVLMLDGDIYTYDKLNDTFIKQSPSDRIKLIEPVQGGKLLVATHSEEVYLLDCISLSTKVIYKAPPKTEIRCLCESMPGEFWIGTDNGLFIRRENEIYDGEAFHDDATPASISANLITSIDKDLSGNMWVGTFYTGINIWKDMRDEMTILFRNPTGNSIKGEVIRRISTDSDGVIWFCSEDGWLGCIDPKTRKTGNWNLAGNLNMHDMIMDEDMIWLCSYGDGLYVFDLKKKKLIRKYDLPDNTLSAGIKLSSGDMLIGSVSGLYLYDTENDGFTTIEDLEGYDIHCLYEDSMGTVWIGTYGQGIICLDQDFRIVARYEADEASNGLTSKLITSFFEDSKRRMWVTTEGGGVCLTEPEFSRDKIRFRSITMENGIPSNVTCAVAEDKDGTIWISTTNGIISISPEDLKITGHLNRGNTVTGYQYSYGAVYASSGGTLYFGNTDGLVSFMPSLIKNRKPMWQMHLTGIEARNPEHVIQLKNEGCSAMTSTDITVRNKDASAIFISYSVPEYTTRNTIYRYSLYKGKRESFSGTTQENSVLLTGLGPGKYRFEIGTVGDTVLPKSLDLTIKPHLMLSKGAYCIYILIGIVLLVIVLRQMEFRRKQERARQYAKLVNNKEKEIYNAKINFFTNFTHEIRTPLTLIKMPLDKIIASEMYTAESKKDLLTIQANADRLLSLTNQLLDMRKMESNEMKMSFIKEDLCAIVRKAAGLFEQMAIDSHISMTVNTPENPLMIMCAKDSVLTIIVNLLSNALKYGKSAVTVNVAAQDGNTVEIRVESDGDLIPESDKEKIFEIFFQRNDAVKSGQGTGLGLPYARNLANMHNGKLYLDCSITDMNSFVLELPVIQQEEVIVDIPAVSHENRNNEMKEYDMSRHTVIIVEDSEQMRNYLAEQLSEDYNVKTAANGADALQIIQTEKIDLIVSDIMMPIMDGCKLCNAIKTDSDFSHIPVILLTAAVGTDMRIETLEVGADGYIEKPFPIELLKSNIANLFKNKEISYRQFINKPLTHYSSVTASKVDQEYMEKLHEFIMKHIAESDLNIETLTMQLGTSKSSLYRKLKANTGLSINEYVRLCRLKQAAELLSSQKYKINEVAFMTGFSSASYFATCFQKQFDLTPSEFVKNLGQ